MHSPLDDAAFAKMADAIFRYGPAEVVEADSKPGQELRAFRTVEELLDHAHGLRHRVEGTLHLAVRYPDMGGELTRRRIELCSADFDHRQTAEGWGLIYLYLLLQPAAVPCFVSANSRQRAETWFPHYPAMSAPERWNWAAVERHKRRLRGVLKVITAGPTPGNTTEGT